MIRKISNGVVSTIIGKKGESGHVDGSIQDARFNYPTGIIFKSNSLYVCDRANNCIRKIDIVSEWNTDCHKYFPNEVKNVIETIVTLGFWSAKTGVTLFPSTLLSILPRDVIRYLCKFIVSTF